MKNRQERESSLRDKVVKYIDGELDSIADVSRIDSEKLIAELHVHQVELEMQNEELRQALENLEQTRAKYIDLYEAAPVGYLTLGAKGKILNVNLTAASLLGLGKSQVLHRPFTDFVESDSQDVFYFYIAKVRKSAKKESCELKLRRFGEKSFFAHLESLAISQEQSAHKEIRISFIDVHESKMNAIALKETADRSEMLLNLLPQPAILIDRNRKVLTANRIAKKIGAVVGEVCPSGESLVEAVGFVGQEEAQPVSCLIDDNPHQQRLVTVIEDSNDAVYLMNLQGNIMAWNRRAEEMYGYSAADALKMSVFDLIPAGLKKETQQLLSDIRTGALVKPFETRRLAKDGSVLDICLKVTRLVQDKKIVAVATTERDITDHNRLFASLQELPGRIILAQEKERSRISQVLHSEFGQSLIALKLFTTMAASELPGENFQIQSAFKKIKTDLDKIINDARNLAHELSPPGLRYVGLVPAIKDLVESSMHKDGLEIRFFHRNMDQACFKKNDIIIYRILQEALQNMLKHAKATRARVNAVVTNSVFTLEVSDNGCGFDPALRNPSRGLGLALMREQASLIGGTLSVESHEGKGTSIKVMVPVREAKKNEGMSNSSG